MEPPTRSSVGNRGVKTSRRDIPDDAGAATLVAERVLDFLARR